MTLLLLVLMACTPPVDEFVHPTLASTHGEIGCSDCHGGSTDADSDWSCATCHEAERPQEHDASDCGHCHSIADWEGAAVDHSRFFPLPHEGIDECSECHPSAGDRSVFTCIDCHEHRQSEMDDEHRGEVTGYRYESSACLDCHPNGREEEDGDDG